MSLELCRKQTLKRLTGALSSTGDEYHSDPLTLRFLQSA